MTIETGTMVVSSVSFATFCLALVTCSLSKSVSWLRLSDRVETAGEINIDGSANCEYTVHLANNVSEVADNVQVGDQIYHKVVCADLVANMTHDLMNMTGDASDFCLIVFNCSISNFDKSQTYLLLDENGCSLEPSIIEHAEYPSDMEAGIRGQAIRFIGDPQETTTVYVTCQARKVPKAKKLSCAGRRPVCSSSEFLKIYQQ